MADEIMQETFDESQKYIDEINNLKQNSVSKTDYEKLQNENRNLLKSLVEGQTVSAEPVDIPKRDLDEIRTDLIKSDLTNLDFITTTLELRDRVIEAGGTDPFLPVGHELIPTDQDIATAERVANVLKECVDYADGDSKIFTDELQRRMVDSAPARRK